MDLLLGSRASRKNLKNVVLFVGGQVIFMFEVSGPSDSHKCRASVIQLNCNVLDLKGSYYDHEFHRINYNNQW